MPWWLALINTLAALVTSGFGVAALVRPALFLPPGDSGAGRFYPAMYAGRAIPLGLAVAVVVWLPATAPPIAAIQLAVAALAQVADVITGALVRQWGLLGGAAFGALCHAVAAIVLV